MNDNGQDIPLHVFENKEFLKSPDARALRILGEYVYPGVIFEKEKITDTVVFFGSSRIFPPAHLRQKQDVSKAPLDSPRKARSQLEAYSVFFEKAGKLSHDITKWAEAYRQETKRRICVVTGGGPGIMEAANRGAKEAGGESIGLNITLPFEPNANTYISENLNFKFHYFFMRKYWFLYYARILIVFPGGFGTLDELFETLTLVQTKNIKNHIPIVLFGKDFWNRLINFDFLSESGMISQEDLNFIHFVDTVPEALAKVKESLHNA